MFNGGHPVIYSRPLGMRCILQFADLYLADIMLIVSTSFFSKEIKKMIMKFGREYGHVIQNSEVLIKEHCKPDSGAYGCAYL